MRTPAAAGFEAACADRRTLILARKGLAGTLLGAGLNDPERYLRVHGVRDHGRGAIARVAATSGRSLILKKYRRGGALAAILPDLFVRRRRMLDDLRASEAARAAGVPSSSAVALILRRRFGTLWSAYLVSEEIPDAVTLARAIATAQTDGEPIPLARAAVRTVRRLHDAGIVHRDLNLRNLLVSKGEVFVIDLDGATIVGAERGRPAAGAPPALRFANLSRLDRSYVKLFRDRGPLTHDDRVRLLSDYCGDDADLRRDLESRLASHKRALRLHALLWGR